MALIMETEKIPSLVMKFFSTAFVSLFFNAVYNLVDALFVSRGVGDNAMGGVSIIFPFMIIQAAIAQTVGGGAASIVSRMLENHWGVDGIWWSFVLAYVLSSVTTVTISFCGRKVC